MEDESLAIELPTTREMPFDPPRELGDVRDATPIRRLRFSDGHVGWLVTGYELARTVLGDRRLSMNKSMDRSPVDNQARRTAFAKLFDEGNRRVASGFAGNFLNMDPPEHTKFRRLVVGEFTPAAMSEFRPRIDQIVSRQLDTLEEIGSPADLVEHFALPIPSEVICEILGVPGEVRGKFEAFSTRVDNPSIPPDEIAAAYDGLCTFLYDVVADEQVRNGDGLMGRLARNDDLNDDDLVGVAALLTAAGHQTTANMLAFGVYALLADRNRWEALVAGTVPVRGAVEELLRYLTIFQLGALTRTAVEDIEVGGVTIRAGESVTVSLTGANRDPGRFEHPDRFDMERRALGHVAFGFGIHACLGQHLARAELESELTGLLERFPDLDLAVPADEVVMHPGFESQAGPRELPVKW